MDKAWRETDLVSQLIIGSVQEGIIFHDLELRYQVWNAFMERLTGMPASAVLGRHPSELFPFMRVGGVMARLEQTLAGMTPAPIEFPYYIPATGRSGWAQQTSTPLRDPAGAIIGVIAIVRDITESKQAEMALRESEERYRAQFRLASEGIITHTREGELLEVNEAFARMHGYLPEEMVRGQLKDLDVPDSSQCAAERLDRIMAGEALTFEVEHRHRDGHTFPLEVSASAVSSGGKSVILAFHRDITERKQAELALRDAYQFNDQIIKGAEEGIVVYGMDLKYRVWNPFMERLTGFPASAVLGRHPSEVFPHLEEQGRFERLERALAGAAVGPGDFPYRFPNTGKSGWATNDYAPLRNSSGAIIGVIGLVHDITPRKQAENRLTESEERYRTQFNLASEGIIAHNLEGDFLEVNETFARLHGYSRQEMLKMGLKDINLPGLAKMAPERLERLLAGESVTFEVRHLHKDGHVIPLEVVAGVVLSGGQSVILAFHRDITERKQIEEERAKVEARLRQSERIESLGLLAGGVAHDMNNVLGAILGLATASQASPPAGPAVQKAFDTIAKAAVRGGEMVKSLLALARQSPDEERDLDLNAILWEEAHLLEHTTLAKVRLDLVLAPDLLPIRGDEGALTHAIMNLCVNAVDAMPDNGTLTLRTRNLDLDWVEVMVEDTGDGMTGEVLARALDPFFTTKPVGKGTGLGLSMVYSTVKAHHGRMDIESEPGLGTRVRMRFPACGRGAGAPPIGEDPRPAPAAAGLKVLLVDDDELIQSTIQMILEVLGHAATLVASGEEALAAIEAGLRPDVVILDLNMPGLGGAGTLPRLRALLPEVPVLLATGRADQSALDLAASFPGVALLAKPFSMADLQKHIGAMART